MNTAIILAGGKGTRMGANINKTLLKIKQKTILEWSIEKFQQNENIDEIILVARKEDKEFMEKLVKGKGYTKLKKIVEGGKERQDSCYNGLMQITKDGVVLFHNSANCLVDQETINEVIKATKKYGAAVAAQKSKDTIKIADKEGNVKKTVDRNYVWLAQTPQAIQTKKAKKVFKQAIKQGYLATDDVGLIEKYGEGKVKLIQTNNENIKITTPPDLKFAKLILK